MGSRAQKEGKGFEIIFQAVCNRQGFSWIKIPTGARIYGRDRFGKPKYTLTRSPFDFAIAGILEGLPVSAFLDCKSIDSASFPKSLVNWDQVNDLERFERVGHPAGYLIYLRKIQRVVFFKSSVILKMDSSLKPENGIDLGDLHGLQLKGLWPIRSNKP